MLETTNLLNYYNGNFKENVEVIGYLYDNSPPVIFKTNSVLRGNLKFYSLKLFAVRIRNEWKLTRGFIKVAINETPLGSIVRLKGSLSKSSKKEDTRVLNLIKFRKDNETKKWNIEPIKPQKINESNFPLPVLLEYQTFKSIPICYDMDENTNYNITPIDTDDRTRLVETSFINSNTSISSYREQTLVLFEPYDFTNLRLPSLYLRLINELYYYISFVISTGQCNTMYKNALDTALNYSCSSMGYSKKPSKTEPFFLISDDIKIDNLPYIRVLNSLNILL